MFQFLAQEKQLLAARKRIERLQAGQQAIENASAITFVTLAEKGSIDEVTATEHAALFSPWVEGGCYGIGAIRRYEEGLYRCVQAHTAQSDWAPDKTPALWVKIGDPLEEFPAWSQPIGAHDAYAKGDKVSFDDKHWQSTVDGNVWQPDVYGWIEV